MKMKRTCTGVQILEVRVVRGVNRSLLETERDKNIYKSRHTYSFKQTEELSTPPCRPLDVQIPGYTPDYNTHAYTQTHIMDGRDTFQGEGGGGGGI